MFEAKTYIERRERLRRDVGSGLLLFLGNRESGMNFADNLYPFRQDGSFLYLFGLDQPDLAAVVDADDGSEILFGDEPTLDEIVWIGPQPSLGERGARVGMGRTAPRGALAETVARARREGRTIHYLPPYRPEHLLELSEILEAPPGAVADGASEELITAVVAQRSIKSDEEVEEIEEAAAVTVEMHLAAMRMACPGLRELDVAVSLEALAQLSGGRLAFPSIVTVHGETLHNHYHGNVLESGQLLLVDAGAESGGHYAADMSRTFPVAPTFDPRQREVYQVALDAHLAAVAALAPGVRFRDVHLKACRTLAAGLKELGLMKGDTDEAVERGAHALFFQCGTGHMMGLDVHDMEALGERFVGYDETIAKGTEFGLKSLRLGRALEPGFVVTVEPGIYFIPELIDQWRAEDRHADFIDYERVEGYRNFGGLRPEEDFLITADGARLLGPPLAKTIEEIEEVRAV